MKKLLVVVAVLSAFVFGQSLVFAQDTISAPKDANKTEMKSGKSTHSKGGRMSHKGKKHHKKNMPTPNN